MTQKATPLRPSKTEFVEIIAYLLLAITSFIAGAAHIRADGLALEPLVFILLSAVLIALALEVLFVRSGNDC